MGQSDKGPTGREGSGWQNRLPLAQFVRKVLLETIMVRGWLSSRMRWRLSARRSAVRDIATT